MTYNLLLEHSKNIVTHFYHPKLLDMETSTLAAAESKSAAFQKVGECLYRHVPSGGYYALVKRGGKQIRRSLKTQDRQLAQRRLADFRDKVVRLTPDAKAGRTTFADLAEHWFATAAVRLKPASAARKRLSLCNLSRFFGPTPVRNLVPRDCEEWMRARSPQVAASTFNNERDTLHSVLDYAKREGLILDNPAERLPRRKADKSKPVIPSRDEFVRLLDAMRKLDTRARHAAELAELLAYSGMRLAEATALRWGDVDFTRGQFTVTGGDKGTKNHEARAVPLFPSLRTYLERRREEATADALVNPIASARRAMASACAKAGLPEFTHHALRHFFVSNAIEQGVDFKTIAAWVGHKDGGVLVAKTYGHLRDTHSAEMAKRMTFDAANKRPSAGA